MRVCADACSGDGVAPGEIDAPCSIKDLDNFRDSRLRHLGTALLSIERTSAAFKSSQAAGINRILLKRFILRRDPHDSEGL